MSLEKTELSLGINLRGIYFKEKKKKTLNNKIDNALFCLFVLSSFYGSCSKIFLWQNGIYLPGSGA